METVIDQQTVLVQTQGNMTANISETEAVVLGANRKNYYGVNEVGTRIWQMLESPINADGIVATLLDEYEVEQEECLQSVLAILNDLLEEQLIQAE